MAEAYSEYGNIVIDQRANRRYRVLARCRGIARPIREQNTVRLVLHDLVEGGLRRHHRHVRAFAREHAKDVAFDTIVDDYDAPAWFGHVGVTETPGPGPLSPFPGLPRCNFLGEVETDQAGKRPG